MKGLTDKQQEILDFISEFTRQEGMAPTIYEISTTVDMTAHEMSTQTVAKSQRPLQVDFAADARSQIASIQRLAQCMKRQPSLRATRQC